MMGPLEYGAAIELIKKNPKLVMMRKGWHGTQLNKKMHIRHLGGAQMPSIVFNKGNGITGEIELDFIFLFVSDEKVYTWNPSPLDMESNDWMILEIDA